MTRSRVKLRLRPVTLAEGQAFIRDVHRHSKRPLRWICAVGLVDAAESDILLGVACLERPKGEGNCDGWTAEISRCCVGPDLKNACSMLYGAMCRAASALGYKRVITYTLATETGVSLKASGFTRAGESNERQAHFRDTPGRTPYFAFAVDQQPVKRVRWERYV